MSLTLCDDGIEVLLRIFVRGIALHGSAERGLGVFEVPL